MPNATIHPDSAPTRNERFEAAWSEKHLRNIWEESQDGLRLTDDKGIVLRANPAYCRIFGKTRDEIEGHSFTACYAEKAAAQLLADYSRCLMGEESPLHTDWDVVRADGQRLCLEVTDSLIQDASGPMVLSALRDVTEKKQAQKDLSRSEEKYRELVETTPDWIWEADLTGRIRFSNQSVEARWFYIPIPGSTLWWSSLLNLPMDNPQQTTK